MKKVGKALFGVLLGLLIVELGLRVAGFVYLRVNARGPAEDAGSGGIVCVGDSNTFGLYLTPGEAYPAALERLLPAEAGPVLNLGIPGMGADHVARKLPEQLEKHRPRIVIALAGVNNTWSDTDWKDSSGGRFLSDLRIVKFFQLLAARDELKVEDEPEAEAEGEFRTTDDAMGLIDYRRSAENTGDANVFRLENRAGEKVVFEQPRRKLESEAYQAAIANRFESIVSLCRETNAVPVMLTYPFRTPTLRRINDTLRDVARERDVLLVDLERELAPYVEALGIDELAFPDRHPRALGTELMAKCIYRALRAEGLVEGPEVEMPSLEGLRSGEGEVVRALAYRDGKLVVRGRHGDGVRLLFSTERGNLVVGGQETGLGESKLLEDTRARKVFFLPVGPSGEIEIEVPEKLRREGVFAVALFGNQSGREEFAHRSDVVALPGE